MIWAIYFFTFQISRLLVLFYALGLDMLIARLGVRFSRIVQLIVAAAGAVVLLSVLHSIWMMGVENSQGHLIAALTSYVIVSLYAIHAGIIALGFDTSTAYHRRKIVKIVSRIIVYAAAIYGLIWWMANMALGSF